MALPVLAIAAMAADLLSKNQKDKADYTAKLAGIDQQRLANEGAIFQGGRASGGYGQFVQPRPEQHDNGLGAALQLIGGLAGGGGDKPEAAAGSDNVDQSASLLKGLGGQNGLGQSILKDYDPERDAGWKSEVTFSSNRPALSDADMLGDKSLDLFADPKPGDDDDSMANRLSKRFRL
jgi:hypothetical protein